MALKDTSKTFHGLYIAAIGLMLVAGVGILLFIGSSNSDPGAPALTGDTRSVRGVVTRVVQDCIRDQELVGDSVVSREELICDLGSFITVDGVTIATSSGDFSIGDDFFSENISSIDPGETVEVIYRPNGDEGFDVNCSSCGIQEL